MKRIISVLIVMAFLLPLSAQKTCGYTNPVLPGFYPDPSVCRVGDDYYLVNSSFQFFPGVPIFHSKDLIHWNQIGNVLDRESQLPLKNASAWLGIYAPTIRYNDGTFYMVTTNVGNGNGSKANFFVTATDPAGPWSDPVWLDQGGIDPSLFFEDGHCYLTSNPNVGIWLCEIDPKTGEQLTESREIWKGDGGRHPEAPHIYKKDGWYYLMIAEGGTEMGHHETIARSRNIYGPYESNPDNPILYHQRRIAQDNPIQGTGHADLIQAHDGSWWMVCLAFRTQANNQHLTGRETYLAPVTWTEEGWPVVHKEGVIYTQMDVKTLPQSPDIDRSVTLDFTKVHQMPHDWVYLRNPHKENYRLSSQGLELKGTEIDLNSIESPTFVARRQQDIKFKAATTLRLTKSPVGATAGLSVYMDCMSHYEIAIEQTAPDTQCVVIKYQLNALYNATKQIPITEGSEITLQVKGSDDMYDFAYSTDNGKTFNSLGGYNARYLSTETAGGFTGITLGLFATGQGTAVFSDFSYNPE